MLHRIDDVVDPPEGANDDEHLAVVEHVLAAAEARFAEFDVPSRTAVTVWATRQLDAGLSPAALIHHVEACDPTASGGALRARLALPVREVDYRSPNRRGWVQVPHRLIADREISDAAVAVWVVLGRIPDSERQWVTPSYAWLASQLGWTGSVAARTARVRRALDDAAAAGLVEREVVRSGQGRGTAVRMRRHGLLGMGEWEQLPWDVTDRLRGGQISVGLLRTWLRWVMAMGGTGQTTLPVSEAAQSWGVSERTVGAQRRALVDAGLLVARRRLVELPEELVTASTGRRLNRQDVSSGPGKICRVSSSKKFSSKKIPHLAAIAASESTRASEAAADATAEVERIAADDVVAEISPPAQTMPEHGDEGVRRGGRAATDAEVAAGRLLLRVPAWSALPARARERWQVRSKMARWVRRLVLAGVSSEMVVDRINRLVDGGDLEEHTLVELVDLAAVELVTEAKAVQQSGAPVGGPRLTLVGSAARSQRPGWWHSGPAPAVAWDHPEEVEVAAVVDWVHAQLTRVWTEHGPDQVLRVGQKIAQAGRRTPWAATIDLAVTTVCSTLPEPDHADLA